MTVGRIQHHGVHAFGLEGGDAVQGVGGDADAGGHSQAALSVLAGGRIAALLEDILIGNKAHDVALSIHHGQFFHLVLLQHLLGIVPVRTGGWNGDQAFGCHHILHGNVQVLLEADVAVGHNTHKPTGAVGDRNAADVILLHQAQGVPYRLVLGDGDRVYDHAVLGPLHLAHLAGLGGDAHILMNNADSSFPCQGDGHRRFCHGVHGGGHNGDVEGNIAGEPRVEVYLTGKNLGIGRNEKDIVKSEAFHGNSVIYKGHISVFLQS